jgi:hypothetical protein
MEEFLSNFIIAGSRDRLLGDSGAEALLVSCSMAQDLPNTVEALPIESSL